MVSDKKRKSWRRWYARNWSKNNQQRIQRRKRFRKDFRLWLDAIKSKLSCLKCGENHIACLDFHHRNPKEKSFEIGQASSLGKSRESVLKEILKCDVLCKNCHAKEHHHHLPIA